MQLAVKNGSLIKNGNDLSGGCGGGGGPDNCNQCVWAGPKEERWYGEGNAQAYYYWRTLTVMPCAQFSWKPGYPEALAGTLWIITREQRTALSADGNRESNCISIRIVQCVNGKTVDITDIAGNFPDYVVDHPAIPGGPTITTNCRDYQWAFDGKTNAFTNDCPETWLPGMWANLSDPNPPNPILVCPQGEQWYVDCYWTGTNPAADCSKCGAGPFATYDEANQWTNANPPPDGCDLTIVNPARKNPLP